MGWYMEQAINAPPASPWGTWCMHVVVCSGHYYYLPRACLLSSLSRPKLLSLLSPSFVVLLLHHAVIWVCISRGDQSKCRTRDSRQTKDRTRVIKSLLAYSTGNWAT